ncbi:hypothetical protein KKF55_00935 [Patescibacteria group bacterium]|nr:hypothetical protein [Patescibacteria group bacterium]
MADNPKDITNHMILKAIQGVKQDVRGLKGEMLSMKGEMLSIKDELQQQMTEMEVRLEEKIVEESDRLAMVMIPTNKQIESEIVTIKQHVGLAV